MADKDRELIIEVCASGTEPAEWLVSGPKYEGEEITGGDVIRSTREAAIDEARHRATWVKKQPVRIEVAAGDGHDAEEWVEDTASS
ncbi:hypothetical protein [Paracoccus onubensis]|uniref:DUF2188 domain-containing protein n=1 Tax=Paracoccus onubensis TaxID=1675788 RepID=A0A418SSV4_9RHOB|nr:hypothetical protein [Paracoccus onubensis]RJE84046.1 hypothetical protein D3P04_13615 [Paracoccus onubensis]